MKIFLIIIDCLNKLARILSPEELRPMIGTLMAMDVHWMDVKLNNEKIIKGKVVRIGMYISGKAEVTDGSGELNFQADEILDI